MKQRVIFNEKQVPYLYMPVGNGKADVFIREFVEEKEETLEDVSYDETTRKVNKRVRKNTLFIYNQNEFRIDIEKMPESLIKDNPMSYIDYDPTKDVEVPISLIERIEVLENAVFEIGDLIYND